MLIRLLMSKRFLINYNKQLMKPSDQLTYNKNSNMSQTWRNVEEESMKSNTAQPRFTRYDMSFKPNEGYESVKDFKCDKNKNK